MKTTIATLSLLAALLTATATPTASAEPTRQSATGSDQLHLGLPLRTFSFTAHVGTDGTATGEAQIDNRASGARDHFEIDCLNVLGNIAVVSGIAWSATGPGNTNGDGAIFAVEDNGQGATAAPDRVTYAYTGSGLVCTDVHSPADLDPSLFYDAEGGNIQIHS